MTSNNYDTLCQQIKKNDPCVHKLHNSDCNRQLFHALEFNKVIEEIEINDKWFEVLKNDQKCMSKLTRFFFNNKQLRVLYLHDYGQSKREVVDQVFQGLLGSNLKEIQLFIYIDCMVSPVVNFISQSSSIEKLSLTITQSSHLFPFAKALRTNRSLKHVKLDLPICVTTRSSFEFFFYSISFHPTILCFDLAFLDLDFDSNECMLELEKWFLLLAKNNNSTLQTLQLRLGNIITPNFVQSLRSFLNKPSTTCKNLSLTNVHLSGLHVVPFASMLQQQTCGIETLTLKNNDLNCEEWSLIANSLANNQKMKSLCLNNFNILTNSTYAQSWKDMLIKNTTLQELTLQTDICLEGVQILLEGLSKNTSLKRLSIEACEVINSCDNVSIYGTDMVKQLANVLYSSISDDDDDGNKNMCSLTELTLSRFDFVNDNDWIPLCTALQYNTRLKRLELINMGLGNKAMSILAKALTINSTLQCLNVSDNRNITMKGIQSFYNNRSIMNGLKEFYFDYCGGGGYGTSKTYAKLIASGVKDNNVLTKISFMDKLNISERFYLDLNMNGRYFLSADYDTIPLGVWPFMLSRIANNTKQQQQQQLQQSFHLLNYFLREKNDLLIGSK